MTSPMDNTAEAAQPSIREVSLGASTGTVPPGMMASIGQEEYRFGRMEDAPATGATATATASTTMAKEPSQPISSPPTRSLPPMNSMDDSLSAYNPSNGTQNPSLPPSLPPIDFLRQNQQRGRPLSSTSDPSFHGIGVAPTSHTRSGSLSPSPLNQPRPSSSRMSPPPPPGSAPVYHQPTGSHIQPSYPNQPQPAYQPQQQQQPAHQPWSQSFLKRKMSHDRAMEESSVINPPISPSSIQEINGNPAFRSPTTLSSASGENPPKRRGSTLSGMTHLSLNEGAGGYMYNPDRRDSSASLWSNNSYVSSSGFGTPASGSTTHTSFASTGSVPLPSDSGHPMYPYSGQQHQQLPTGSAFPSSYSWPAAVPGQQQPSHHPSSAQNPNTKSLPTPIPHHQHGAPSGWNTSEVDPFSRPNTGTSLPVSSRLEAPNIAASALSSSPLPLPRQSISNASTPNTLLGNDGLSHGNIDRLKLPALADLDHSEPGTAGGYSRSPELRVSHKLAERKRRKEMKELFDELKDSLPSDRGVKSSKWEILSRAVDFIGNIKASHEDQAREIELLRRENEALRNSLQQQQHGQQAGGAAFGPTSVYPQPPPPHAAYAKGPYVSRG